MHTSNNEDDTDINIIVHPGEMLRDLFLRNTNMSPDEFSRKSKIPLSQVTALLEEKIVLTEDMIKGIQRVFPEFIDVFKGVQNEYLEYHKL